MKQDEKDAGAIRAMRMSSREEAPKECFSRPAKRGAATASPTTSSRPIVIPTRNRTSGFHRRKQTVISLLEGPDKGKTPHDPNALPPAVAALLAVTSLPSSKYAPRQQRPSESAGRSPSRQVLVGFDPDEIGSSLSSFSPRSWDVLLSPPQNLDGDKISVSSVTSGEPILSVQSISIDSMPSLSSELESATSVSSPSTPIRPATNDRRQRGVSSPRPENCVLDHPLLPPRECESSEKHIAADTETLHPEITMPATPIRSSFKSNLTASLRVLRSAARSVSNFTAPTPQRDDFLTRSILSISPRFTDEMRPQASAEPPDPALRRYLNPSVNPAELQMFHGHGRSQKVRDEPTASIQLQTYQRMSKTSKKASAPPVFLLSKYNNETLVEMTSSPSRQREPRENCDFLRVIVLEMNMRRSGKLSDSVPGRARMWLKPRQTERREERDNHGIPKRWVGIPV